jgi:glycerol kinase
MPYILSLDAGTTSVRAILFDAEGRSCGVAQKEIRQIYPRPGWVEHDANEIWQSIRKVASDVVKKAGLKAGDIAAIGITNQRETTVVWDRRTGEPLGNAIVWQDRRTAGDCDRIRAEGQAASIQRRTGLILDAYFSGTKIAWILDHTPGARARARAGDLAFGTIDTWLVWKLTGGESHITDVSNASRTLLFNLKTAAWDPVLLELFQIPESLLPKVASSSEVYGEVTTIPSLKGVPISGIAGDQQSALFGQMCLAPGSSKCTYGTGCFLLQNTGTRIQPSRNRLLSTVAWKLGSEPIHYAQEGSVFIGGATLQWLRDGLRLVKSAQEVDRLACTVPDSGGVLLVPAFAGLGAPHWDSYARGLMIGITRDTTAAHVARAALEGIALQVADLLDAMRADTGTAIPELRVDGGASRSEPLMQIQADLLGCPVVCPSVTETTALGAAYLAGLGVGFWKSPAAIASQWKVDRVFKPKMSRDQALSLRKRWDEALERAKAWEQPAPVKKTTPTARAPRRNRP